MDREEARIPSDAAEGCELMGRSLGLLGTGEVREGPLEAVTFQPRPGKHE